MKTGGLAMVFYRRSGGGGGCYSGSALGSFFFIITHSRPSSARHQQQQQTSIASRHGQQQVAAECHALRNPLLGVALKVPPSTKSNQRGYASYTNKEKSIHDHDNLGFRVSESSLCCHGGEAHRHEPPILGPCGIDEVQEEGEDRCKPVSHGPSPSFATDTEADASSELQKKIKLLESEQWSPNDMARLREHKAFTSCSVEHLTTVLQLLKECFGKKAYPVLLRNPKALSFPLEALRKKLRVLMDLQFDKVAPHVRMLDISSELLRKKVAFYEDLGLTVESRHKMLLHSPRGLASAIKDSTVPSLEYLESIGVSRARVLKDCPIVLAAPCVGRLVHQCRFFQQLGLSALELLRVLRYTFYFRSERLQLHIESMKELGFSEDDLHVILITQPSVITLSPNNVRSKLDYAVNEQGRKIAEVVRYAVFLSLSLEGRIIPRFKSLEKLRLSKVYSLGTILGPSDARFEAWWRKKASSVSVKA